MSEPPLAFLEESRTASLNGIFGISDALSEDAVEHIVPPVDQPAIKHGVPKASADTALTVAPGGSLGAWIAPVDNTIIHA